MIIFKKRQHYLNQEMLTSLNENMKECILIEGGYVETSVS